MKLNGIEDTQSLIEEKARDANGKYFYPNTGGTMKCFNKHIKKKDLKSLEISFQFLGISNKNAHGF